MALNDIVLQVQAILGEQDPHWMVRDCGGQLWVHAVQVETSYPLEPEAAEQITKLIRDNMPAAQVLEISFLCRDPHGGYRNEPYRMERI